MTLPVPPDAVVEDFARGTAAVTVTFGRRTGYLRQVLAGLETSRVGAVYIVDNATPSDAAAEIDALARDAGVATHVVRQTENHGSAGGYERGIRAAMGHADIQRFWLLDDDNVPAQDALTRLCAAAEALRGTSGGPFTLASHRPAKAYLVRVAEGTPATEVYPRPGSAHGVHLKGLWRAVERRLGRIAPPATPPFNLPWHAIPWGPFGGLLLPREAVEAVGYPRGDLFLYADDVEYTHRLVRGGWRLLLVPDSVVRDVAEAGLVGGPQTLYDLLYGTDAADRVYYHVRNQTFFEGEAGWTHSPWYPLNRALFEARTLLGAVRSRDLARYRVIRRALRDGRTRRLGRLEDEP